ncbi:MAG: hypothetical protein H7Y01_03700 [Ferruginibacter sp.]|nr:hypothetical protein [Chitinophagaceae bacterium]
MKFSPKSVFFLLAAFFTGKNIISGQVTGQPDTLRLEKHISILNNKLFFDFPAAAAISPRVADIMAADPNENRETRIITENGKMRLVFFAQELYALGGKTLFEDISKEIEPGFNFQRKIIFDKDSILAILSTPALFDSTSSAILVNSLLVKSPDNTVSRIDVYINPEAYPMRDEYARLAENVFKTISKGTRRINLDAKEETYKIFGTQSKFIFKLPKNYLVTVDEKYDFGVFKLNKYKNSLADTTYTSLTIYTGHHPSYFHKEYGYIENKALKTKGEFLQANMEWLYFKDDEQSFYLKEQFIPAEGVEKGLIFHVAMLTNKKDILEELVKIVENIKVLK